MHVLFIYLLLIYTQVTIAQSQAAPKDTIATRYQLPGADCALFPAAIHFAPTFEKSLAASGRFTPTRQQVANSEKALPHLNLLKICVHPVEQNDIEFAAVFKQELKSYRRQYYGFYNSRHEPCLYINFFNWELPADDFWLKHRVHIVDGGFSVWSVNYNLHQKTFANFKHEYSNRF